MRKHITHLIQTHRHSRSGAPALKQMPALAVLIGHCLAIVPTSHAGPNLGHLHQAVPQTVPIDLEVFARCCHIRLPFRGQSLYRRLIGLAARRLHNFLHRLQADHMVKIRPTHPDQSVNENLKVLSDGDPAPLDEQKR